MGTHTLNAVTSVQAPVASWYCGHRGVFQCWERCD